MLTIEPILLWGCVFVSLASAAVSLLVWIRLRKLSRQFLSQEFQGKENAGNREEITTLAADFSDSIFLPDRNRTRVKFADIIYIKAEAGGINYYTKSGVYFTWQSVKSVLEVLPDSDFIQVNRSTVLGRSFIKIKEKGKAILENGEIIITSPAYKWGIENL